MKLTRTLLTGCAVLGLSAAAAYADQPAGTPFFVFDVERVALHDASNTMSIYERLVSEAGAYCSDIVARESVEYPVCVDTMVTHVVDELGHAPLTRVHEAAASGRDGRQQAVAYNAG